MFNKRFLNKVFGMFSLIIFLTVANVSLAGTHPAKLKLLVIDKVTKKPLANKSVEIYSDNGIRCIKAPCPTNGIEWTGKTDKHGYLVIPQNIRQASMTMEIAGYRAEELNRSARKLGKNSWKIVLARE